MANPWSRNYAYARSVIALATFLSLALTPTDIAFAPYPGDEGPRCPEALATFGFFCIGIPTQVAKGLALVVLLLVVVGWRPRLTGLPHAWVAFSLQGSLAVVEGGDQIASNVAILLIPVALLDDRKWHWSRKPPATIDDMRIITMIASVARWGVSLQVAVIYLHSAVAKTPNPFWQDGTAVYYWLNDPSFGVPSDVRSMMAEALTGSGVVVTAVTWGTILLEFGLAASLVATASYKRVLLLPGLALHAGIALFLGLSGFSLVMVGALLLLLDHKWWSGPIEYPVNAGVTARPTSES